MSTVTLYRVDAQRRMARYYCLDVQPDLFGEWCLIRMWGRIGTAGGQVRSVPYPTPQEADAAMDRLCRAKLRRGYAP